jgi:hypothetical protein
MRRLWTTKNVLTRVVVCTTATRMKSTTTTTKQKPLLAVVATKSDQNNATTFEQTQSSTSSSSLLRRLLPAEATTTAVTKRGSKKQDETISQQSQHKTLYTCETNNSNITAKIRALISRTRGFIPVLHAFYEDSQQENVRLITEWRHFLFQIQYHHHDDDHHQLLTESVQAMDRLVNANLDNLRWQERETQPQNPRGRDQYHYQKNYVTEMVATGIYAWGRLAHQEYDTAPPNAEALVTKLQRAMEENLDDSHNNNNNNDDTDSSSLYHSVDISSVYSALVYCWSQAGANKNASERALYWFRQLEQCHHNSLSKKPIASETWNSLLRILVRQGKFRDMETQQLLRKYQNLHDGYTFASLVRGWMTIDDPTRDDIRMAHDTLQAGISFCMEHGNNNNNNNYNNQMTSLHQLLFDFLSQSVQNKHSGVAVAERVLQQMISLQQDNPGDTILKRKHFVVVMRSLASGGHAKRVSQLFKSMTSLYELTGDSQMQPDYQVLVIMMSALAKTQSPRHLTTINKLLLLIEKHIITDSGEITNHAFNVVLDFYSRLPGESRRYIEILMTRMEEWAERLGNPNLLPDRISYAALLQAIVAEGRQGFDEEVDDIVHRMEMSDRPSMLPDVNIYALFLDAIFKSGSRSRDKKESLLRAERLFRRINQDPRIIPDEILYTLLMKIYSIAGDVDGSDRILTEMIDAFETGRADCCPTEMSFVTAMNSWGRSRRHDAPEKALTLYNTMMELYRKGIETCRPCQKTFGQLMVILAQSKHKSKWKIGRRLLREMNELDVKPDLMVLHWFLSICETASREESNGGRKGWEKVQAQLKVPRGKRHGANSRIYNTLLDTCHNLSDDPMESMDKIIEILEEYKEGR